MAEKIREEVKAWLKETGYTVKQMDNFWEEAISFHTIVATISKSGKTWRSLHISAIKDIPELKQLHEKTEEEKARLVKEKAEREEKERADAEYYSKHFDEIILQKIEKGEPLDKDELRELVHEYKVETHHGSNRRWTRTNTTIICLMNRYFKIKWDEGLTEYQENEYWDNKPREVFMHTYQKMVEVTEWLEEKPEEKDNINDTVDNYPKFSDLSVEETSKYF